MFVELYHLRLPILLVWSTKVSEGVGDPGSKVS